MNFNKKALLYASLFLGLCFSSCKNEKEETTPLNTQETEVQTVPFFEAEKGEDVPKGIFRDKPLFDDEGIIDFYSSEDDVQLRASGVSSSDSYNTPIYDIKLYVSKKNDAPETKNIGGKVYRKIPVDLNEGAGGKWIYLYYARVDTENTGITFGSLGVVYNCCFGQNMGSLGVSPTPGYNKIGFNFDGGWQDLNEGAGGHYMYLQARPASFPQSTPYYNLGGKVILDIGVVSLTAPLSPVFKSLFPEYTFISTDLNMGAGGKYIYLFYK
ncbi:MAG: hypothetical protein FWC39_08590 [Bacteroidetes bacterium]|nr:hypothetical protein [Bacteroidota bacterium]